MADIRSYHAADLDALYAICLATADAGADAAHLYADPTLIGHVYAGAYAALSPDTAFVAHDSEGVGGYVIGPADTADFETRCEAQWWPALRARHPDPNGAPASADERMCRNIHHPLRMPRRIAERYPAHLHINLLPRLQGQGLGRALIDRWRARVAVPAHLAVGTRNARAVRFYRAYGFAEVERFGEVIVFGIGCPPSP